jgi:ferredoxin
MPSYVDPEKCDGCKGGDKTACMYICPKTKSQCWPIIRNRTHAGNAIVA